MSRHGVGSHEGVSLSLARVHLNNGTTNNDGNGEIGSRHRSGVPTRRRGGISLLSLDNGVNGNGEFSGGRRSTEAASFHTAGDS